MRHGPRSRRHHGGRWRVFARVERFTEPALLLLLRERPAHGYDLLERLPELTGEQRVEMGNIYRLLRAGPAGHLIVPSAATPNRPMSAVDVAVMPGARPAQAGE